MKKNISINLFGTLYHIDEDAYELLDRYMEGIKRYFRGREGDEDIADDIEHRVAELLWERKQAGQLAVDIQTVKEVIAKIGTPNDIDPTASGATGDDKARCAAFAEGEGSETSGDQRSSDDNQGHWGADGAAERVRGRFSGRRLYRDMQDSILGGVCSGLTHYFGMSDPLLMRIILVLLFLFTQFSVGLLYIIFWLLVPEAQTPEERLRMRGEAVTPEAINAEMLRQAEMPNNGRPSDSRRVWRIILVGLLLLVGYYLFAMLMVRLSIPILNSFFHGFFNMIPNL